MNDNFIKVDMWGTCIWGIDEEGTLILNEGTIGNILAEEDVPWLKFKNLIVRVKTAGKVIAEKGNSTALMFKGMKELERAELAGFTTEGVTDMHSMFEGCVKLSYLDISDMNTLSCSNMSKMFKSCRKLTDIVLGEGFSLDGDGTASCDRLAVKRQGRYRHARVIEAGGANVIYSEPYGTQESFVKTTVAGVSYRIEDNMFASPRDDLKFIGWNTEKDGSGDDYKPGDRIDNLEDDLEIFAIFSAAPIIGKLSPLDEIIFGSKIPFVMPEIISENDPKVSGYLEISKNGEEGSWEAISHDSILPVSCNGCLIRLCAYNRTGKSYSNPVKFHIAKADLDMSSVRWVESGDMSYDGNVKSTWLEGLPEGVKAEYTENEKTDPGTYIANAELIYDRSNYNDTQKIREHRWTIKKAHIDISKAIWDYSEAFIYDGSEKSIELKGLPENIEVKYQDNKAVNAGMYTAKATPIYDDDIYDIRGGILPCRWQISKALIESKNLTWKSFDEFVYDGEPKNVFIENLPEDAEAEYSGELEYAAGKYLATCNLIGNYYTDKKLDYEWEIKKARYDMSGVKWDYAGPFVYDGTEKQVVLSDKIPGLDVVYAENRHTNAGDYSAVAIFTCLDSHNYETPEDMKLNWTISKKTIDMSDVRWNYEKAFVYDGSTKNVELEGLPQGVYATYAENSACSAGIYNAHADLKYDKDNYSVEKIEDCRWRINKAKIDISNVAWNYEEPFVYNGKEHTVQLTNVPTGLDEVYSENTKTEAGQYVATVRLIPTDINNYEEPKISGCAWAINKAGIDKGDITWSEYDEFVYDGEAKTVKITSDIDSKIKVDYSGNYQINAGVYTAVAKFTPLDEINYKAPESDKYTWEIKKSTIDMRGVSWDYSSEFTYDGTKKKVVLSNLPKEVKVTYENAEFTDAGDYVAVARIEPIDKDNYSDNIPDMTLAWKIKKAEYDLSKVKWQDERKFSYDGYYKKIELVGLPDGIEAVYTGNEEAFASEYIATAQLKYDEKNYERPSVSECRWMIEKSPINIEGVRWNYDESFTYDGSEKIVELVNVPEDANVKYGNNRGTKVGTYTATANIIPDDIENLEINKINNLEWKISKGNYDMSHVRWDYQNDLIYDGVEHTVELKGLPEGVIPKYRNNRKKDAGKYKASVTFSIEDNRNYNVPTFDSLDWEIKKTDMDMSRASWNYHGDFKYASKMYDVTVSNLPDELRAVYSGNAAADVGSYEASVDLIPFDLDNYNKPTIENLKWCIAKADYDMSLVKWDYNTDRIFNGRPQNIMLENLPSGVSAEYIGNEANFVGKYEASARLSVMDPSSYNVPSVQSCSWEIRKADYDMSGVSWNFTENFKYDGKEKEISLKGLPESVIPKYHGNKAVDAGTYLASVSFTTEDANYNKPDNMEIRWHIDKADLDVGDMQWNYRQGFTYDGNSKHIELVEIPDVLGVTYKDNNKTDAGIYNAVASFKSNSPNYNVPEDMTCEWSIEKADADISMARWDYSDQFTYDGEEKKVTVSGLPDYIKANYTGNTGTEAGDYNAHAELIPDNTNNYNIPNISDCKWSIGKADYDMTSSLWIRSNEDFATTANLQNSEYFVFEYGKEEKGIKIVGLPDGVEPVYSRNCGIDVGEYEASAEFNYDEANYNRPTIRDKKWFITKSVYNMDRVSWNYDEPFVYDASEKKVELIGLPDGVIPLYRGNIQKNCGEYTASVSFEYDDKNYEKPVFSDITWEIAKAKPNVSTDQIRWNYDEPFIYDGEPKSVSIAEENYEVGFFGKLMGKKPEIGLVGIPDGFIVEYEDNVKTDAGVYYAKAILRHENDENYKPVTAPILKWEIKKAIYDMSPVDWSAEKTFTYDGEEKSVALVGLPEGVRAVYKDNTAINAGGYDATAEFIIEDEDNYEMPLPIESCWWQIEKASYDMSGVRWSYSEPFEYDDTEKSIEVFGLPEGVRAVSYIGNKGRDAGTYLAEVALSYDDKKNYHEPSVQDIRWKIEKKYIDMSGVSWNYDENSNYEYDGTTKEVNLTGLPENVEVAYTDNRKTNAGYYTARAALIYDRDNYDAEPISDLHWKIEKADYDTSKVCWDYKKPFVYDACEKSIYLKNLPTGVDVRYRDNKATSIGTYTAKAYLTYDSDNYNAPKIDTMIDWEIVGKCVSKTFDDKSDLES